MLQELNACCRRLWRDDQGVVLALTLVVFLTLFLIGSSVYAVGEHVRQRVELQNAADAAAYSAAVVQADAISRIAAINRTMAWTHAQLVKRDMDMVVNHWLAMCMFRWYPTMIIADKVNDAGDCNRRHNYWYIGEKSHNEHIRLNGTWVKGEKVKQSVLDFPSVRVRTRARQNRRQIEEMGEAEAKIIKKLPRRIEKTVKAILKANIEDTWADGLSPARSADIGYVLLHSEDPGNDYFEIEQNEEEFFALADIKPHAAYLGPGFGNWFVQKPADGIQHHYVQKSSHLVAYWKWYTSFWLRPVFKCRKFFSKSGSQTIRGIDAKKRGKTNYETTVSQARKLKMAFFGRKGSIVVGLARRMNNPLQFIVPRKRPQRRGIFKAFTLDDDERWMWTASASRAGYAMPGEGDGGNGQYRITYWHNKPPVSVQHWNLKWSDWDATLLPLRRAWSQGENGEWLGGETGGQILAELRGMPWDNLYRRSGGALGEQGGPKLMNQGAEVSYMAAEDWILH